MPYISKRGSDYSIIIDEKMYMEMGFDAKKSLELVKVKNGIWVITEKEGGITSAPPVVQISPAKAEAPKPNPLKMNVLSKLENASLSDRVVGRFEAILDQKEKAVFNELLKEGAIQAFKLSEKYKKAIYKAVDNAQPEAVRAKQEPEVSTVQQQKKAEIVKVFPNQEATANYTLEGNGFTIIRNESEAIRMSRYLEDRIKRKEIIGTRAFDGNYYVIDASLYTGLEAKAVRALTQKKEVSLDELASAVNYDRTAVKIVCEILRERGELLEKRRDVYTYIQ